MREMKDSGIEWIGEIPKDWTVSRIKYIADIFGRIGFRGYTKEDFVDEGEGAISLSPSNINGVDMSYEKCSYISWKKYYESPEIMVKEGDVIFVKTGSSFGKSSFVSKLPTKSTINPQLIVFKNIKINSKLFAYYIATKYIRAMSDLVVVGGTIPTMSQEKTKNFPVLIPPNASQSLITKFLNNFSLNVDAVSEDIQKEISLLEDYKKSVIIEAVTKGLNPDAEMKDSGIEWIGEIPKHWEVHPVYVYFEEGKTKNYRMQEQNLLSLSYGRIIRKDINTNGGLLPASFNTYNVVEAGDIIIRPTDLQNDKRSLRTGLVKEQGIITSAYIDLRPKDNVNSKYYHYLLHSYDIIKVFYNMGNGVRQGLNFSEFAKLLLLEPTTVEQQQIADYLDSKCSEIDILIADKKRQLDILADYKKSLIYEYVTGKKEVSVNE